MSTRAEEVQTEVKRLRDALYDIRSGVVAVYPVPEEAPLWVRLLVDAIDRALSAPEGQPSRAGRGSMSERFVPASCAGWQCSMCGAPAAAKVGEEIAHDDPHPYRHNLTAYVCAAHFDQIMDRGGYLRADRGWCPAETAPRDGSHFLAARIDGSEGFGYAPAQTVVHYFWQDGPDTAGFYPSVAHWDTDAFRFTHWRPLETHSEHRPAEPTVAAAGGERASSTERAE